MNEIGGYFELDKFIDKPYHKDAIKINTGRNALVYLFKTNQISKVFLPYYLCNSVSDMLDNYQLDYEFYKIDKNFKPIFNQSLGENDYLYIVNFFGVFSNEELQGFKNKYKHIIIDNTHAFFQMPLENVDTLYSCRKYLGVPDGAYVYVSEAHQDVIELAGDESRDRTTHLLGRFEKNARDYYKEFKSNDKVFEELELKSMSSLTENILGAIDYSLIRKRRIANYNYLRARLDKVNKFSLNKPEVPFCYPLLVENGMKLKKEMAKQNIFIPTLWPNVIENMEESSIEFDYASNILPLPCDQRYTTEDMQKIVDVLSEYL